MGNTYSNDLSKLKISIFLLGYKNAGESIVFIIYDDKIPVYSGVIDCYEENDLNLTKNILLTEGIKKINFICLTHPHKDHSLGLKYIFEEFVNNKTRIVLPGKLMDLDQSHFNFSEDEEGIISYIKNLLTQNRYYNFTPLMVPKEGYISVETHEFQCGNNQVKLEMFGVSPNDSLLERRILNVRQDPEQNLNMNDFSVGLILQFEKLRIFFSGDIENQTLRITNKNLIKKVNIIKIPHHSSRTSDLLPQLIEQNPNTFQVACSTTSRGSHGLPKEDVLNMYKTSCSDIYITGAVDPDLDKHSYGIINFNYSLGNSNKMYFKKGGNTVKFH